MPEPMVRRLTYVQAIREALDQAMDRDPRVLVIGEGVPDPKAIFTSTADLRAKYGPQRVFDMPLAENGMTGICIGAALAGMRPVMVHQRIDFAMLAMDQLINNAAKWHYMFDGRASVPIVVRLIIGRGWGQGPQHSQSLQALFAHIPGLKVVMPTTARDAKGLLLASIADDNPVIFIEHRWLHNVVDEVPEEHYTIPIGKARTLHQGSHATIAAFSYMALESVVVARELARHSIDIDVIDMRSARPLDVEAVLDSVRKTGRLLVVDTGFKTGSLAGELVSQVAEKGFGSLKAAPRRIASPDHPVPTSPFLAESYYPTPLTIADAILELANVEKGNIDYAALSRNLTTTGHRDVPNPSFTGPF